MKLSVIIGAVGKVELTQRCVASVRACARMETEIVLVDNGSTHEESVALAGLRPDVLLTHRAMLGYPAAMNAGVRAARGEYVCLLNNDAQVTQRGWDLRLTRLLDLVPGAEIVAPVSDFARAAGQQAATADSSQAPVQEILEADRVVFVCAVMRRSLFERLGPLDERYGLGNWEDTDYCYRVRQAGGRILIDPYVFVRHVGHQTMATLPDFGGLLEHNRRLFMEKWSLDDGATGYDTQGPE